MNEITIAKAVATANIAGSRQEATDGLLAAGVRLYHTDVRSNTTVYSSDIASHTELGAPVVQPGERPAGPFDAAAIEAASAAFLRTGTPQRGFLRRLWSAGVIEYEVNLIWREGTFFGRHGECYVAGFAVQEKELAQV